MGGFVVVVGLVLVALAFFWWRASQRKHHADFIDAFPYQRMLDRRLAEKRPELTPTQREMVFVGLKEFFHLCNLSGRRMVSMPSQVVDDAWHEFILFTRQYQRFCDQGLGRFLHHTPAEAMSSPTVAQDGIKRAWRLACARDGIDPKSPNRLPLLFAIDGMLGIANGFRYELNCMAKGKAGDGYCASDIGCAGGCAGSYGGSGSDGGGLFGGGGDSSGGDGGSGCGGGCGGGD